jgi:hypothetical protein
MTDDVIALAGERTELAAVKESRDAWRMRAEEAESKLMWERECLRKRFIRAHASRLEAAYLTALAVSGRDLVLDPGRSWELARELWDAKPEDC